MNANLMTKKIEMSKSEAKEAGKEYPDVAKFGTLETAEEAQEEEPKNQSVIPMPESQTEKKTA